MSELYEVPEAELEKLQRQPDGEALVHGHFEEVVRLQELSALADAVLELAGRWQLASPDERTQLLADRDTVLRNGDELARTQSRSPLLVRARAETLGRWARAREVAATLSASGR
jgi:hypothetical protein